MTTRDRLLIAICDAIVLQQCGKDVDRARDFDLIKQVSDTGELPPVEHSPFDDLVERVRDIDPEAAEYLRGDAHQLWSFSEEGNLAECFNWKLAPQGFRYWERIALKLSRN